jgi:hypothetical protein
MYASIISIKRRWRVCGGWFSGCNQQNHRGREDQTTIRVPAHGGEKEKETLTCLSACTAASFLALLCFLARIH